MASNPRPERGRLTPPTRQPLLYEPIASGFPLAGARKWLNASARARRSLSGVADGVGTGAGAVAGAGVGGMGAGVVAGAGVVVDDDAGGTEVRLSSSGAAEALTGGAGALTGIGAGAPA